MAIKVASTSRSTSAPVFARTAVEAGEDPPGIAVEKVLDKTLKYSPLSLLQTAVNKPEESTVKTCSNVP
jgi:hypothetical protein